MPDSPRAAGRDAPEVVSRPAQGEQARRPRGFRSQPLALRILLIGSLTVLAVGVFRCSIELTGVSPPIESIGVARAIVDLGERAAWAPPDSIAVRAARSFAASLRSRTDADVWLATRGARGFDAIARIRIEDVDGEIRVAVGIVDGSSGRSLFETRGEGEAAMLDGLLNGAAVGAADALGIARGDEVRGRTGREADTS